MQSRTQAIRLHDNINEEVHKSVTVIAENVIHWHSILQVHEIAKPGTERIMDRMSKCCGTFERTL
jgi:hypothetical protein